MNFDYQRIMDTLADRARLSPELAGESLRIDNIILGKSLYTMKGQDRVFTDMNLCILLLETSYGFAYFQEDIDLSIKRYVNEDIFTVLKDDLPPYFRVALVDALYGIINRPILEKSKMLIGSLRTKAEMRAKEITRSIPPGAKVVLLGAVSEIVECLQQKGCEVQILDLDDQKIGLSIGGLIVQKGADIAMTIESSDYVIATGMTFVTESADSLFQVIREKRKQLILFMETGSNFGPQLLEFGASQVIAEYFPYYDFPGNTKYCVFNSKQNTVKAISAISQPAKTLEV